MVKLHQYQSINHIVLVCVHKFHSHLVVIHLMLEMKPFKMEWVHLRIWRAPFSLSRDTHVIFILLSLSLSLHNACVT